MVMGNTEVGVERPIQGPCTLLALEGVCCLQTTLILVKTIGTFVNKTKKP